MRPASHLARRDALVGSSIGGFLMRIIAPAILGFTLTFGAAFGVAQQKAQKPAPTLDLTIGG